MKASFASSLLLAAALVAAVPARAEVGFASTVPAPVVTNDGPALNDVNTTPINGTANPRRTGRFGWATVGIYNVGVSVDVPDGQGGTISVGGSNTYFGISGGAAFDVVPLMPDLQLSVFGNVAVAFGSDFFLPLDAGLAVHYDALPVMLFFGPAFSLIPHSGGGDTLLGLGLFFMGSYPVPQLMPGLSFLAQFQYHILNDSAHMLVFDVGASLGF
jgi:hypothetical protein